MLPGKAQSDAGKSRRFKSKASRLDALQAVPHRGEVLHPDTLRRSRVAYDNGRPEFATEIRDSWTEQDVLDLIFRPMEDRGHRYPAWEVPARVYGSWSLFKWWAEPE